MSDILPRGWIWTTVAELGSVGEQSVLTGPFGTGMGSDDFVPDSPDAVPVVTIGCLQLSGIDRSKGVFVRSEKAEELSRYRLKFGDVLFSRMATVGRAGFVDRSHEGALFNYHIIRLRLAESVVAPRFFIYFVRGSRSVTNYVRSVNHGATRDGINTEQLLGMPVVLPPAAQQEQIVEAVDSYLSRLDDAIASLERVRTKLNSYRASLLQAAVEGRLFATEAEPSSEASDLPLGWRWITVEELAAKEANSLCDGPFGSNLKTEHYTAEGPRVVRLQNIGDGQFVDAEAHVSLDHFARLQRHRVFAGDLLVASLGEILPRACIVPEFLGPAIVKADCLRFKVNPTIALAGYVLVALNSRPIRSEVSGRVHGVGRPRMGLGGFRETRIPLPPFGEQERIVAEVERLLSIASATALTVELNLTRASRLRQSVLKWAFEGKLVDQDPSDEPADVLLARIRAERDAAANMPKTRGKRAKATP